MMGPLDKVTTAKTLYDNILKVCKNSQDIKPQSIKIMGDAMWVVGVIELDSATLTK